MIVEYWHSDYDNSSSDRIIGVYDNKALAEFMCKNNPDLKIEEFDLIDSKYLIKKIEEFDKIEDQRLKELEK